MAQRDSVDDLLDARAELRRLQAELAEKRAILNKTSAFLAFKDVKQRMASINKTFEECLTSLEVKQGRLPFMEPDKTATPSVPVVTNGKGKRKRGDSKEPRA
jgi:hypothetical protein